MPCWSEDRSAALAPRLPLGLSALPVLPDGWSWVSGEGRDGLVWRAGRGSEVVAVVGQGNGGQWRARLATLVGMSDHACDSAAAAFALAGGFIARRAEMLSAGPIGR